jgi:hypothetical protein
LVVSFRFPAVETAGYFHPSRWAGLASRKASKYSNLGLGALAFPMTAMTRDHGDVGDLQPLPHKQCKIHTLKPLSPSPRMG